MKSFKLLFFAFAALLFVTVANAGDLAIGGYCPVCYIAAGKAIKGDEKFTAEHGGKTYRFVSAETRDKFKAAPAQFLPQYDGYCAYGVANGKKVKIDPTQFTVVDGKVYLNYNKSISNKFNKDPKGFIAKADALWPKLK